MPSARAIPLTDTQFTPRELEVLRLLAAGHTIKSIAARLGWSEASINERLRDARRKAGVGSSRELARLLAAQEIWDRKIDLAAGDRAPDSQGTPHPARRPWLKGSRLMFALPLAAAAALAAAATQLGVAEPAREDAAQMSPLEGTWALDVAQIPAAERPRSVTIAFHREGSDRWTTRVAIVAADGTRSEGRSTAATDGVAVPVSGTLGFVDTASLRQPAANSLVMTLAKGGAPVSTRVYTVTSPGTAMTETIVWPGPAVPGLETTHFRKVG